MELHTTDGGWIGRVNMVKMSVFQKLLTRFIEI